MAQTFADRLKMAMEKAGIATYKELAEIVGVDPNTVTNWVNKGETRFNPATTVVKTAFVQAGIDQRSKALIIR